MTDEIDACYCYFIQNDGSSMLAIDKFIRKKGNKEATLKWSIDFAKEKWTGSNDIYCIFEIYDIKLKYLLESKNGNYVPPPKETLLVIEWIRNNPELGKIHLEKGMI